MDVLHSDTDGDFGPKGCVNVIIDPEKDNLPISLSCM